MGPDHNSPRTPPQSSIEEQLTRLHAQEPAESPHRATLRAELVARFRALHSGPVIAARPPLRERTQVFVRLAVAAVLLIGLGAATQAPAEYPVVVGKRIVIHVAKPAADWPKPPELEPVLQQLGRTQQIRLEGRRSPEGLTLQIEIWGTDIVPDVVEQLRSAFPALREAEITATELQGTARGSLADKLGVSLFRLKGDPESIAAATRELQAKLLAEHQDGTVDVRVEEGPNGQRKVMVKVQSVKLEGAPDADGGTLDVPAPQ